MPEKVVIMRLCLLCLHKNGNDCTELTVAELINLSNRHEIGTICTADGRKEGALRLIHALAPA